MKKTRIKILLSSLLVFALPICSCEKPNSEAETKSEATGIDAKPDTAAATATAAASKWIDPLSETKEQRDARMAWWREARFGLFIHWGVYSVPAGTYDGKKIGGIGEWIMRRGKIPVARYRAYAKDFNPVRYDPGAWVKMAKDAGMKYIVITSKHHDGFSLYDSKVTDWDIVDATPYKKDLLSPLVDEAKAAGLKMGFYYSQAQDWTHPGGAKSGLKEGEFWDEAHGGSFDEYLKNIAYPQVKEILTGYDIDILWWDTPTWMNEERAKLLRPLITLKPGLITNNRLGGGFKGDSDTPEQRVPATGIKDCDWEVCMTMNHTWGYKSYDDDWKSTTNLLQTLVDIVSKGGNFLLNVGPKSDGTIPEASIERLAEIGTWMKSNGDSIYGTQASPFRRPWWGRCTRRELENDTTRLYLQVFDWPKDNRLFVPVNNEAIASHSLTDTEKKFDVKKQEGGLEIHLKGEADNPYATVVVLDIKGSPDVPNQNIIPNKAGKLVLTPETGDLHNRSYSAKDHARVIRTDELSYIDWKTPKSSLEWPIEIATDTVFNVHAKVATQSKGNQLTLKVGEEKQEFKLPTTKGLDSFKTVKLGKISIPSGSSSISLKGNKDKWQAFNLSDIEFRPAK